MNQKYLKYLNIMLLILLLPVFTLHSEGDKRLKNSQPRLNKTLGSPSYYKFNINNISTFFKNDGESDINPNGNSGFEFPRGSNKQAVYQSGLVWGGIVDGQKRVGGSAYRQGTVPGKILNSGVPVSQLQAESPDAPNVRNYRVRPDYKTGDVSNEIGDGNGTEAEIRAAYEKDWMEWPAADGAPYTDVDANGSYDPLVDIPGVPGADQTIWFVCNDTDPDQTDFMYGSPPMGIEEQVTIWGYNTTGALGNMLFRKYKLINKSDKPFNDMYVSMWNDPDNGDATDDYVGCDTTLSMMFCYNGKASDATYGNKPAASGFDFFQGPLVTGVAGEDVNKNGIDDAEDFGIFNGKRVGPGKINLPMSAFYFFLNPDPIFGDPDQGEYGGTLQFFNLFEGKVPTTGDPFKDPTTNRETKFPLAGDPLIGTGWVDGLLHPPGDRRAGMVAGPFIMAPGDEQEVVVAEFAAGFIDGVDRLGALGLLKFYDLQAQLVYDNFFNVATPPAAPIVNFTELDEEIVLNWGDDRTNAALTESYNKFGYKFEGYNVYQLPSNSATIDQAKRIATYDVVNGVGKIIGDQFDPATGVVNPTVLQFGGDFGVQRYISIKSDALKGNLPLNNGSRYYYAVTSYAFNPDPEAVPNVLENPLNIKTVVPHAPDPGVIYSSGTGDTRSSVHATGTANATMDVTVVDPSKVTGHPYEIFFNKQHYYFDKDGVWKKTNYPDSVGKFAKDVSPSSLGGVAVYSANVGTIDLKFTLDLVSPTDAWVDGIKLTFPAGVAINSAEVVSAGGGDVTPEINGNIIIYGLVNGDTTQNGVFHGGEVLTVNVNSFTPPLGVDYVIYDDGYPDPLVPMNAVGTTTFTEVGYKFVTQNHWNVKDVTTGLTVLEDQTVLSGVDIYAGVEGPGGSSGLNFGSSVPPQSIPTFDGLQVAVNGSYDPPINILSQTLTRNGTTSTLRIGNGSRVPYDLTNYTIFGNATGWANEAQGYGTTSIDELQQDYEYRFTGEMDSTTINGKKVYITKEGTGSLATFYGARLYDWALHPLNPTGTKTRFLVRIPFEVWNVDKNIQVNYQVYDRGQSDPTAEGFYVWNPFARMYCEILNTPYEEAIHTPTDEPYTWNNVWYNSRWQKGDVIRQNYANPLQTGKDTWTFSAPDAVALSSDQAKEDVKRINVFPNPYYGVNSQEINKYQRFVTLSHLPEKATIRIFNLAGQLIRTIEKNSSDQFQRWDLLNEFGLPVASGLYIIYVDMPDLGTTKVLKAAIIQEEQILDRF